MTVIIGIDPHKASHAPFAIGDSEHELAGRRFGQGGGSSSNCRVGRGRSAHDVRPIRRARYLVAQSSLARAKPWWTCRRRWRHGCACWARVGRTRTTRTTRAVAIAALAPHRCASVRAEDHATVLHLGNGTPRPGMARSRACCRSARCRASRPHGSPDGHRHERTSSYHADRGPPSSIGSSRPDSSTRSASSTPSRTTNQRFRALFPPRTRP